MKAVAWLRLGPPRFTGRTTIPEMVHSFMRSMKEAVHGASGEWRELPHAIGKTLPLDLARNGTRDTSISVILATMMPIAVKSLSIGFRNRPSHHLTPPLRRANHARRNQQKQLSCAIPMENTMLRHSWSIRYRDRKSVV